MLFTDTLADVNGVSRFIGTIADMAVQTDRELHVITSTRFECPRGANIHNLPPLLARAMPGYPNLDVALPRPGAAKRLLVSLDPDVVHISTPGPVGMLGRRFALKRGVPLVGTYHTDFPAYIDHLFNDDALTWYCSRVMRWFYRPFARVFTRSADYAGALRSLGVRDESIVRLQPGIDTAAFSASRRDTSGAVWAGMPGARASSVKVIYVGRLSVEKNLPMLARVWPVLRRRASENGVDAQLIIVGDGPYRAAMQTALEGHDAVFAGFRHGDELATLYASADVFAFPSTTDTLGQVVMEAQCAGLPVIVTDQGGPKEVVDHERTGLVLPHPPSCSSHESDRAWVEALTSLLASPARRAEMGARGSAKIAGMSILSSLDHFWSVHESVAALAGRNV